MERGDPQLHLGVSQVHMEKNNVTEKCLVRQGLVKGLKYRGVYLYMECSGQLITALCLDSFIFCPMECMKGKMLYFGIILQTKCNNKTITDLDKASPQSFYHVIFCLIGDSGKNKFIGSTGKNE